jgi:hypothetical protein
VLEKPLPGTFPDSRYQDIVSIFDTNVRGTKNIDKAKSHWIQYGKNEKRDWSCHDYYYDILPGSIFANLFSLKDLDISKISYSVPSRRIFAGLTLSALDISGNSLSCVPLTNDQMGALIVYKGQNTTCETYDSEAKRYMITVGKYRWWDLFFVPSAYQTGGSRKSKGKA